LLLKIASADSDSMIETSNVILYIQIWDNSIVGFCSSFQH
jgi:hypothetical protein